MELRNQFLTGTDKKNSKLTGILLLPINLIEQYSALRATLDFEKVDRVLFILRNLIHSHRMFYII